MRNRNKVRNVLVVAVSMFCVFAGVCAGAPITVTSYTLTPGEIGSFNYIDDGGVQLTDGFIGTNNYGANLGNGNAYEWVGWAVANPTAVFQFGSPVTVTSVSIGFNRNNSASIHLPDTVTVNGTPFSVSANAIPDNTRGFLAFAGSWTGSSLTLNLSDTLGDPFGESWIFVDEVQITPEPGTFVLLGAGLALVALRKLR
jgi:hypothetical protein